MVKKTAFVVQSSKFKSIILCKSAVSNLFSDLFLATYLIKTVHLYRLVPVIIFGNIQLVRLIFMEYPKEIASPGNF